MPVDPDERPTATDERWDSGVGSRLGDTAPYVAMKYPRYAKATYGSVDRPLRALGGARPPAGSSPQAPERVGPSGRGLWATRSLSRHRFIRSVCSTRQVLRRS